MKQHAYSLEEQIVSQTPEATIPTTGAASGQPGEPAVDPKNVVRFPDGLPGFEACRRFVVISSDDVAPMQYLHAIEGPAASFLVMDPSLALPNYRFELSASDRKRLEVADTTALVWLAIVTVTDDGGATVNLRAPVVINPDSMIGCQVMPHQCVYPLRHVLAEPN
jgi:flagellar assembly factor FliW